MAQEVAKQHLFSGAWLPSENSSLIGPENFSEMRNMRYGDRSPKGVLGYTKINTTALSTYTHIRNGFQLRCPNGDEYVFVQAYDENLAASKLFMIEGASAPAQADFNGTAVHTDASGAGVGRFVEAAGGQMVYCNGVESLIWGGDKFRCAAAFLVTSASTLADPKDVTEAANNTLTNAKDLIAFDGADYGHLLVFTTRPIQGVGITVETPNSTGTLAVKYWDGSAWSNASNVVDGTDVGGATLAKSGNITWDSTVGLAEPKHFEGVYFYAYMISLATGTADVSHVTVDAPLQPLVDIWDGVFRTCTQFQAERSSKYEDYTLEVNEESSVLYPICALCGGLTSSDAVIVQFPERASAIRFKMSADNRNATASVMTVKYWDGDSWVAVTGLDDGTDVSGATLGQTGVVSWSPPGDGSEFPQHLFGSTGYCYEITFSGTLTTGTSYDGTSVDLCQGLPAQLSIPAYSFAADYKGSLMLMDRQDSTERNRVDFSMPNAPDVFNGDLSSMMGEQALYVGSAAPLRAAASIFNRFGSSVYDTLILLKDSECHMLNGESPEDYQLFTISKTVGCPAPLTLAAAEAGFELTQGVTRNVAMWLSFSGPYMFDGATLYPLKGLEIYFDPTEEDLCVNFDYIDRARGWYDVLYKEYNLLLPTGESTECDLWVAYDLVRKKWFRKDPTSTDGAMPQCGFAVLDDHGRRHCYGGIDSGHLMRLEHGTSWDGYPIWQVIETGDFWPAESLHVKTRIRRLTIMARRIDEDHVLTVAHIPDTERLGVTYVLDGSEGFTVDSSSFYTWEEGGVLSIDLGQTGAVSTAVKGNKELDLLALSHRFRFSVKTSLTAMGFQPIAWGYMYREERVDK